MNMLANLPYYTPIMISDYSCSDNSLRIRTYYWTLTAGVSETGGGLDIVRYARGDIWHIFSSTLLIPTTGF